MATTLPTSPQPIRSGSSIEHTARVLKNEFGEGYRQLTGDGVNMINSTLTLQWIGNSTEIQALITHFEERSGYQTFTVNTTWASSWGINTSWLWSCNEWKLDQIGYNVYTLSATLKREFHLV